MKNNPLVGVLMALLFLSTALTSWRTIQYENSFRKAQQLQAKVAQINTVENVMNSLLADAREYERTTRNPDMARILGNVENMSKGTPAKPAK